MIRRNTASLTVGRLLEVRAEAGYKTTADVDAIFDAIGREVAKLPATTAHVAVVDWSRCPLMSPQAAEHMAKRIAGVNANTLRSAALASDESPVAVLQFVRLIRDANLPNRRLFTQTEPLCNWLGEVLTPTEKARLRTFLSSPSEIPRSA